MELLLYLFGNWLCIGAAAIVLHHYLVTGVQSSTPEATLKRNRSLREFGYSHDSDSDILISKDLLFMFCISSLVRIYWSLSPPPIYQHEESWIQAIAILDLVFTLVVWSGACICATSAFWNRVTVAREHGVKAALSPSVGHQMELAQAGEQFYQNGPEKQDDTLMYRGRRAGTDVDGDNVNDNTEKKTFNYINVTIVAFILSALLTQVLPTLATHEAWPFVDLAVVFNLLLDGMAILPQLTLISKTEKKLGESNANTPQTSQSKASNFLGLLCLGRVFRMVFWLVVKLTDPGENPMLWTFVLPDTIHTFFMADYLYIWLQKVKRDRLDPFVQDVINL